MTILLAIAVFASAAMIDYAHARYARAVTGGRVHAAAIWSVAQWCAGTVGFVIAVRVTMWMLPLEAAGLYTGTFVALRGR